MVNCIYVWMYVRKCINMRAANVRIWIYKCCVYETVTEPP